MKILVTGGAGYIGSVLVPVLLENGHHVTVLDNFMYKQTGLLGACHYQNLEIVRGDVRDTVMLKKLVKDCDVVIPLACLVGAPLCDRDPWGAQAINADAVKALINLKSKNQKLIYPCTNSGYGIGQSGIHCDETQDLRPVSLYGKVKVEAEKYLLDSGEGISLRLATVFGASPRMRLDLLVNDFVYRAIFDGSVVLFEKDFKRNYVHIRDVVDAFLHTINNYDKMVGNAFNVGISEANLSKEELCIEIKKVIPRFFYFVSEEGKDPDCRNYIVSNEKIEKTGFKAKRTIKEGVIELKKVFEIIKNNSFSNQ